MKEGWTYKKLGEIAKIKSGKSIEANKILPYDDSLYPCYGGNGIRGYVEIFSNEGDIPIIGRVGALCGNVHLAHGKLYATEHALVVDITNPDIDANWLSFCLQSLNLRSIAKGVAQPVISAGEVSKICISIPSLKEQQQIVSELDLLTDIIEKQKAQIEELDKLAQSIFYDMFGDPLTNTMGWDMKNIKDIAISKIGLTYKPSDVVDNGTIVLRSSNIQENIIDLNDIVRVSTPIKDNLWVEKGDILMCSRNGSFKLVGKVAMINDLPEKMTYGAFMTIIKSQYNNYLFAFFKSPAFRAQLGCAGTATINQITVKMLNEIKVPLPPLALQQEFAAKIEAIEQMKAKVRQSLKETEELFNSRMDYYFN